MAVRYLEYIESTGTQYIDTGFKPNQDTRVVMDFEATASHTSNAIFGARVGYIDTCYVLWITSDTSLKTDLGNSEETISGVDCLQKLHIDKNKSTTTVNGVTVTNTANSFQSNFNMFLFGMNQKGSLDNRTVSGRIGRARVYDNGTLIKDFRAALDENDRACMYEEISGTYVYSPNGEEFIAGPELNTTRCRLPRRIVPVVISKTYTITLTGEFNSTCGYVLINGTKYTSATTLKIDSGTEVSVYVGNIAGGLANTNVILNGEEVLNTGGRVEAYTFTPTGDTTIKMIDMYDDDSNYSAEITMNT